MIGIMLLMDILRPESIIVPLQAADRETAISLLIGALELPGTLDDRNLLREAVLAREKAGSTGIGRGVAIPHARTPRLGKPLLAAGRLAKPIEFAAADAKPVSLIFLLAVPEADPRSHLQVLAALSRLTADAKILKSLNRAASAREFLSLLAAVSL